MRYLYCRKMFGMDRRLFFVALLALFLIAPAAKAQGSNFNFSPLSLQTFEVFSYSEDDIGQGRITSNPEGIDCRSDSGGSCSADFTSGSQVTLTATPDAGDYFTGFGGEPDSCESATVCTWTVSEFSNFASGAFSSEEPKEELYVEITGEGGVTSSPAGINCVSGEWQNCSALFTRGSQVTLEASPQEGWELVGWGGAESCGNNPTCTINMDSYKYISAEFEAPGGLRVYTGSGGRITSSPAGIDCQSNSEENCFKTFAPGTEVTLQATGSSSFRSWFGDIGDCVAVVPTCTVTMNQYREINASFNQTDLEVSISGSGDGRVLSSPEGIDCYHLSGGNCFQTFTPRAKTTLTAIPPAGSVFAGWRGDFGSCEKMAPTCTLLMDRSRFVAADFLPPGQLNVSSFGGSVVSSPAGINCSNSCSHIFPVGTTVTLQATPNAGNTFSGWGGDAQNCKSATCTIKLDTPKQVWVDFNAPPTPGNPGNLEVSANNGTVTSSPAGISCSNYYCEHSFSPGTTVTLQATPDPGYSFIGWSGDCEGKGTTCSLQLTESNYVGAGFRETGSLEINQTGPGVGAINSSPSGINCGNQCAYQFSPGQTVTLQATAAADSFFAGWSGDIGSCQATNPVCTVTIGEYQELEAQFYKTGLLEVEIEGEGVVASNPEGIYCGDRGWDCWGIFTPGNQVTLTASPQSGYAFDGWEGAEGCQGLTCEITMGQSKNVTAKFIEVIPPAPNPAPNPTPNPQPNPAKLTLSIAAVKQIKPGKSLQVSLRSRNEGGQAASSLRSCLTLPAPLQIIKVQKKGKKQGRQVCWSEKTLDAQKSAVYKVKVKVPARYKGKKITLSAKGSAKGLQASAQKALLIKK